MGSARLAIAPEFKDGTVEPGISSGRPVTTVARSLGLNEQSLRRCVNAFKEGHAGEGVALSEVVRTESIHLRKENAELKPH